METKKIQLFDELPDVTLDAYYCGGEHPAIVVLPGGAYMGLAGHEGDPIAFKFMSMGFNAFVLSYSVGEEKAQFPRPLKDVSAAIVHIRTNAKEYGIDPERIFVTGSSAGGHLAGAIGTMWHWDCAKCSPDMEYGANRPTGVILSYPCITTDPDHRHDCPVWVKGELSEEEMSLEKNVNELSAPAFIWHSCRDTCVPVMNSLLFAEAYAKQGLDFELRIYNEGDHGTSLGTNGIGPYYKGKNQLKSSAWADDAIKWALEF